VTAHIQGQRPARTAAGGPILVVVLEEFGAFAAAEVTREAPGRVHVRRLAGPGPRESAVALAAAGGLRPAPKEEADPLVAALAGPAPAGPAAPVKPAPKPTKPAPRDR
jgi:hypothetical protein